jgi:hypothetical protein
MKLCNSISRSICIALNLATTCFGRSYYIVNYCKLPVLKLASPNCASGSQQQRRFCEINIFNVISVRFFLVHKFLWRLQRNWICFRGLLYGCKFLLQRLKGVANLNVLFTSSVPFPFLFLSVVHNAIVNYGPWSLQVYFVIWNRAFL